jgi:hypothetical protein
MMFGWEITGKNFYLTSEELNSVENMIIYQIMSLNIGIGHFLIWGRFY